MPTDPNKARYYRKQIPLFRLVEKMKLWPSRRGILHGIKEFEERGSYAVIVTHCDKHMVVHDSKTSRAARWLRNKWYAEACPQCRIPEWKLQKYAVDALQARVRLASARPVTSPSALEQPPALRAQLHRLGRAAAPCRAPRAWPALSCGRRPPDRQVVGGVVAAEEAVGDVEVGDDLAQLAQHADGVGQHELAASPPCAPSPCPA